MSIRRKCLLLFPLLGLTVGVYGQKLLLPVQKGDLYGFWHNGEFAIPAQYQNARRFSQGLAAVEENNRWGFIDSSGQVIIPLVYKDATEFSEGLAMVTDSQAVVNFVDHEGKRRMPSALFQGRDFSDGLAAVRVVSQWFYVDQHGVQVMPKTFFAAGDFSESVAPVKFDNGEAVFINRKGEVMLRGNFVSAQKFSSGLAPVQRKDAGGKVSSYFINHQGAPVFAKEFENAGFFSGGLAAVKSSTTHLWGYIDSTGKLKIPYMFAKAGPFTEGISEVVDNSMGYAVYITKTGDFICRKTSRAAAGFGGLPDVFVEITADPDVKPDIYLIPSTTYIDNNEIMKTKMKEFYIAPSKAPLKHLSVHQYSYYLFAVWPDGKMSNKFFNATTHRAIQITK